MPQLNYSISSFEKGADPDQLALRKPADQDPHHLHPHSMLMTGALA